VTEKTVRKAKAPKSMLAPSVKVETAAKPAYPVHALPPDARVLTVSQE
jgi:hypothetical protein